MPEETVVAESSSAVEAPVMDASRGPLVDITPEQRAEFRKTGNLPEPPKKEEAAASPEPKPDEGKAEPAGDSETPESKQEKAKERPKQTAAERIAELKATIAKIEKGAGIKTEAESSPAKPEAKPEPQKPNNYQEWRKTFNATKWVEDYSKENPEASYEEASAAMADHLGDVRDQFKQSADQEQARSREFNAKVEQARSRYENFDEVVQPAATAISSDAGISPVIKTLLEESDVLPDILFTLGNDPAELAKFVKMAKETPGKALRYIALTESLITEELEGKSKPEPLAPPKTQAPKPPSEVGGRATSPGDELASAAKAGDFRAFKAEANRRMIAKLKG